MSEFTSTQIAHIRQDFELGIDLDSLIREYEISKATFYKWPQRIDSLEASKLKRVRHLKGENAKLKRMYADSTFELDMATKWIIEEKL